MRNVCLAVVEQNLFWPVDGAVYSQQDSTERLTDLQLQDCVWLTEETARNSVSAAWGTTQTDDAVWKWVTAKYGHKHQQRDKYGILIWSIQ